MKWVEDLSDHCPSFRNYWFTGLIFGFFRFKSYYAEKNFLALSIKMMFILQLVVRMPCKAVGIEICESLDREVMFW